MNNKRFIERPKSHYEKSSLSLKERRQTSFQKSPKINFLDQNNENNLDDFFDRFHETFIVLEAKRKVKDTINEKKKVTLDQLKKNKQNIKYFAKSNNVKQIKSFSTITQDIKSNKTKVTKSFLSKNNKTCQSDRNILANCHVNSIVTKKISEKKSELFSKRKSEACSKRKSEVNSKKKSSSSNQNSKKYTTKKKIYGTGSTAATTVGNSAINRKDDIHIASYLRIKIKGT